MDVLIGKQKKLFAKAKEFGVFSKIDNEFVDEEYIAGWMATLDKYKSFVDLCHEMGDLLRQDKELLHIDPHCFINTPMLLQDVKMKLHDGSEQELDQHIADIGGKMEKLTGLDSSPAPPSKDEYFEGTVYVIDIDYEYEDSGTLMTLYTRDINDHNATRLLLDTWQDYFYIDLSNVSQQHMEQWVRSTTAKLRKRYKWASPTDLGRTVERRGRHHINVGLDLIIKMELVEDLKNVYGFQENNNRLLKVTTRYPTVTKDLFYALSKDFPETQVFEANLDFLNKYMAQRGISGCCAVDVKGKRLGGLNNRSTCDYRVFCESIVKNTDAKNIYLQKNFYFDIEVLANDVNVFPTPDICPVIQISYVVSLGTEQVLKKGVLCLGDTPGDDFESYSSEEQLLLRFYQLIHETNPETFITFNGDSFDFPYIFERMRVKGLDGTLMKFSRKKNFPVVYRKEQRHSAQKGAYYVYSFDMPGRASFDMLPYVRMNFKLDQYGLGHIAKVWIGDTKEDLQYKDIPHLFTTPEGRAKIASYCLQDSALLLKLDSKKLMGLNVAMMAKTLGCTLSSTISRGIGFKLMRLTMDYTLADKFVIPSFAKDKRPVMTEKLQGAYVFEPRAGKYDDPVVCLDFGSLYPSIIRGWNLSYDSRVFDVKTVTNPDMVETMSSGYMFVKREYHEGLVPKIERVLMAARTSAKKMKKKYKEGSIEWNTWEATQLAIKVACNSYYGLLGSPTATLPMLPIAQTITRTGRDCLFITRDYVEEHFHTIVGRDDMKGKAKIIYGDTDSVFVEMKDCSVAEAIDYGQKCEKVLNDEIWSLRAPMTLEYEKCFSPFLIVTKKRYCGQKYEFDANKGKPSWMGLAVTRRNSPPCLVNIMQGFIDAFCDRREEDAVAHVENYLAKFWGDRLPLDEFVLSKKLSKLEYTGVQTHITVRDQIMAKYGEAQAPTLGERVTYVLTHTGNKRHKVSDKVLNMICARADRPRLDLDHYFSLIYNPMHELLLHTVGLKRTNKIMRKESYTETYTVKASRNNLLGFFNKSEMTVTKKSSN